MNNNESGIVTLSIKLDNNKKILFCFFDESYNYFYY